MVVVTDERRDVRFEIAGQEVVLKQDSVLQRLMPALDLALRLRMVGRAARMRHALVFQILGQITGYVTRPIVGQQTRTMHDIGVIESGFFERQVFPVTAFETDSGVLLKECFGSS